MKKILALLLLFPILSYAEEYDCIAEKVYDGDSITKCKKLDGSLVNVRLAGIDAPERSQPYGLQSREALQNKIQGYLVHIEKIGEDTLYNRDIGYVYFRNENINTYQVLQGNAWYYEKYSDNEILRGSQEIAKLDKRGLWKDENPTAPWDYRRKK